MKTRGEVHKLLTDRGSNYPHAKNKKPASQCSKPAHSLMLRLCSQPLLFAVTECKFARGKRWTTLCDITIISTCMHAVGVCLDGEKGGQTLLVFLCHNRRISAHLRPLCAVAPVVDGCWDAHHHSRDEVPRHVIVLPARELALEHLNQHEVQLHALQTHPGERTQEAEVENAGDDGAHKLTGGHMQG